MNTGIIIFIAIGFMLFVGFIGAELGLTQTGVESFSGVVTEPDSGGISAALAPFTWAFSAAGSFFQMMTFQAAGIPVVVNTIIFLPFNFLFLYIVYRMIRGGG